MIENRRHFRIREYLRVKWTVTAERPGDRIETGEATIMDISDSGLKIVTDNPFKPFDRCVFLIEAPIGAELPFGPQKARMIWFRRIIKSNNFSIQCGLEFIKSSAFDKKLKEWLDEKVTKLSEVTDARILTNYFS